MMTRQWSAWGLAVVGLWLAACGGLSEKDFSAAAIEATCRWQARCGLVRDEGACIRESRARFEAERAANDVSYPFYKPYGGSLRAGRMSFDEDRAGQCVAQLRALSCEDGRDAYDLLHECRPYVGQRQGGESCLLDEECVSGFDCELPREGWTVCTGGTCVPRAGLGERPVGFLRACARGLGPDRQGLCQPLAGEGEPCSAYPMCRTGLYCDSRSSTCRPRGQEGDTCVPGVEPCLRHLDCADDGVCHRRAGLGGACTTGRQLIIDIDGRPPPVVPVLLHCQEDLRCEAAPSETRGICRERSAEGGPCASSFECEHPLVCDWDESGAREGGRCERRVEPGQACGLMSCDRSGWCDTRTGTCARRANKVGDACDLSSPDSCSLWLQCEQGRCAPAFGGVCEAH